MQNKSNKILELIPTVRPNEYSVRLNLPFKPVFIGRLNTVEGRFTCRKAEEKHIHRNTNSIALNAELLNGSYIKFFWIQVELVLLDGTKKIFNTSREYFLAKGISFQYKNYEPQIALPLELWGKQKALDFHRKRNAQATLFSSEAA